MVAAATAAAAAVDVAEVVIQDEGVPPEQKALAEETATVSVAAIASLASQLKQDGYCIIPNYVAGHPLDAHELEESVSRFQYALALTNMGLLSTIHTAECTRCQAASRGCWLCSF